MNNNVLKIRSDLFFFPQKKTFLKIDMKNGANYQTTTLREHPILKIPGKLTDRCTDEKPAVGFFHRIDQYFLPYRRKTDRMIFSKADFPPIFCRSVFRWSDFRQLYCK